MDYEIKKIGNLSYAVKYPDGFDKSKKYPAIIFLHGAGSRGTSPDTVITNPFFSGLNRHSADKFIVFAPTCNDNSWFDHFEDLKKLVYTVSEFPNTDKTKIYGIGTSMGSYGIWQLAMSLPEFFAAIIPVCGGGMYWNAGRLINVPVWAFHGAKDTCVFPEESKKMVNAVNACGGKAKLTIYPENTHNAWDDTYSNPEVFNWLLSNQNKNDFSIPDSFKGAENFG